MDSGATASGIHDPRPHEEVGQERAAQAAGVQASSTSPADTTTTGLLPVPQLVEPSAPTSPVVEPDNKHSPRVALGSTTGQHTQKQKHQNAILLPTGKGNAAKIFPAHGARGESLANFGSTPGDAQNYNDQQDFAQFGDGVTKPERSINNSASPRTPPFSADASKIAFQPERQVHSVKLKLNDARELFLEYAHPTTMEEMHNMTVNEDFMSHWSSEMKSYFDENYVKDEETELTVGNYMFKIAGHKKPLNERQDKLISRRRNLPTRKGS